MADNPQSQVDKWLNVTKAYDNEFKKWDALTTQTIRRYRDTPRAVQNQDLTRFNILWSNVQTLKPAVYSKLPKADVSRRFSDTDPVGRVAALLLERALDYEIEHYSDYRSMMNHAVEDRFLGGRGVGWVRYEPHIKTQDEPEDGVDLTDVVETEDDAEPAEEIEYECAPNDYVHWKDFGHTVARTWEEVPQVWRWVYMTKEAATERFGDVANKMSFNSSPEEADKRSQGSRTNDRAKTCELWDKDTGKAFWFQDGCPEMLDERDDPLRLEGFFPCGKPLYATTTSDSLVPVPDFIFYKGQALLLDTLADRIGGLVEALRVRGVYDASQPALQRLLTEGENNILIPVDKWGALSEKGGLQGSIDILPINDIAACLLQAYQAMENIKGQIYEITGIADIVRGEGAASESATAQQIKGQYVGLRLRSMQETVALFASEQLRLKAQVICSKYQDKTILAYAAADQLTQEDQALVQQALQLLKSSPLQAFRIEVAADSLVQLDENQNKQDRVEFLNALANFLREAVPAGQSTPELAPMLMKSIQFGIAGFKAGKELEGTIDTALQQLTAKAAQPAPPTPEAQKMQADQQQAQAQMQADAEIAKGKAAADLQVAQLNAQHEMALEQMKEQARAQQAIMDEAFRKWKAELDAATQITVAEINAKVQASGQLVAAETAAAEREAQVLATSEEGEAAATEAKAKVPTVGSKITDVIGQMAKAQNEATSRHMEAMQAIAQQHAESMDGIAQALQAANAPKRLVRGPDGRAVGMELVK